MFSFAPSLAWRLIAYAFVFVSAAAIGASIAYKWEQNRITALHAAFDSFKAQAAELGAQQRATISQLGVKTKDETDKAKADYEHSLASIRRYYAARLRSASRNGSLSGAVPSASNAAGSAHASASDVLSAQADTRIREACAETTAQLVALQDWIRHESIAWRALKRGYAQ